MPASKRGTKRGIKNMENAMVLEVVIISDRKFEKGRLF
jgi:hypothetical protein